MIEIYGLYDPETNELRYVGKAKNAQKRLKTHILDRKQNRPVCRWVGSLVAKGMPPVVRVLETVGDDQWEAAERRLIAEHRKTSNLLNLADGGAMPSQTKEQRRKAARASNAAQAKNPEAWQRFVRAKKDLARMLTKAMNAGEYSFAYRLRFRMRLDYARSPELHATWANL